jgi:transcriptional regulator with XRE-family HTH domain
MKYPISKIGLRIRALRESREQTQTELATKCRRYGFAVTRQKVAHYEHGRTEVPACLIPVFALVLREDITELLPPLRQDVGPQSPTSRSKAKNITGARIKALRMKSKWSQRTLANSVHKMGVPMSRSIIANLETCRSPATDYHLVAIAKALAVPLNVLFPDPSAGVNAPSETALH